MKYIIYNLTGFNSKGKKYKTIKIEPIGKGKKDKEKGRKFVKEISEKTINSPGVLKFAIIFWATVTGF